MVSKAWNRSSRPGKNPENVKQKQYLIKQTKNKTKNKTKKQNVSM
jgi:hypothetical protein